MDLSEDGIPCHHTSHQNQSEFSQRLNENGLSSEDKEDFSLGDQTCHSAQRHLNSDDPGLKVKAVAHSDSPTNHLLGLDMLPQPLSQLPKPQPPPGAALPDSPRHLPRSKSMPETDDFDVPAIGKFFRDKSYSLSAAFTKRISSLRESKTSPAPERMLTRPPPTNRVTEIKLSGLKVIVNSKPEAERQEKKLMGRISFFSRSNCRDCTAVRSYFRSKNLNFAEINIDVFPAREKELVERTGNATVPQIFLNEKLLGGLVALNSMRNSGILEKKMEEMLAGKCPAEAPEAPAYGFDDPEEEREDEMVQIVRVLRQRLPIEDRLTKMKIAKNCFSGGQVVEVLIQQLDCGRRKVRTHAGY